MIHVLNTGLSYCRTGGRLIFLDLEADRYFCLAPELEEAVDALAQGAYEASDETLIARLIAAKVISSKTRGTPLRPFARSLPHMSYLDRVRSRLLSRHTPLAVISLIRSRFSLWRAHGGLSDLMGRKTRVVIPQRLDFDELIDRVVAVHSALALMTAGYKTCLWRSLALVRHLRALGCDATLVFGVQARPFRAHCWVESQNGVVNDRLDRIEQFEPILAL